MKACPVLLPLLTSVVCRAQSAAENTVPAVAAKPLPAMPQGYSGVDVGGMLMAFVLVLGCLFVVSWLLRRTRLVSAPAQSGVSVISQLPLGMKDKLLVVQVGDERLLIGATPGNIRTLHTWKADAPPPAAVGENFSQLLAGKLKSLKKGESQ